MKWQDVFGKDATIKEISFAELTSKWLDKNIRLGNGIFISEYGHKEGRLGRFYANKLKELFVRSMSQNEQIFIKFDNGCKIMLCHEGDVHILKENVKVK